jgi:hypothetical protein
MRMIGFVLSVEGMKCVLEGLGGEVVKRVLVDLRRLANGGL